VASSLGQFAGNMNRTADRLPRAVSAIVTSVGRAISYELVDRTPVDTGEARSNWLPSLGVPLRGTIAPYTPYPKGSKALGKGTSETANAQAAKQRIDGALSARAPGQTFIVQNSVEHINLLNSGSSKQAPALFVEQAVAAGIRTLNGANLVI
jgi:hypothetical protein